MGPTKKEVRKRIKNNKRKRNRKTDNNNRNSNNLYCMGTNTHSSNDVVGHRNNQKKGKQRVKQGNTQQIQTKEDEGG